MAYKTTGEKSPIAKTVPKVVEPCEICTRKYDKKSFFCKSCVENKDK